MLVGSQSDKMPQRRRKDLLVAMYALVMLCQAWLLRPAGAFGAVHATAASQLLDQQGSWGTTGPGSAPGALAGGGVMVASVWYFLFGLGFGGVIIFRSLLVPEVFGRKALGRINAIYTGVGTAASGAGPLMLGGRLPGLPAALARSCLPAAASATAAVCGAWCVVRGAWCVVRGAYD